MRAVDWKRLAEHIRRRRIELGISKREAVRRAGIGSNTWLALENDGKPIEDHNWANIARAMEWTPGSIQAVLIGGDPEHAPNETDGITEQIAELRRRIERLEAKANQ